MQCLCFIYAITTPARYERKHDMETWHSAHTDTTRAWHVLDKSKTQSRHEHDTSTTTTRAKHDHNTSTTWARERHEHNTSTIRSRHEHVSTTRARREHKHDKSKTQTWHNHDTSMTRTRQEQTQSRHQHDAHRSFIRLPVSLVTMGSLTVPVMLSNNFSASLVAWWVVIGILCLVSSRLTSSVSRGSSCSSNVVRTPIRDGLLRYWRPHTLMQSCCRLASHLEKWLNPLNPFGH